jgi:membrane-associated protein
MHIGVPDVFVLVIAFAVPMAAAASVLRPGALPIIQRGGGGEQVAMPTTTLGAATGGLGIPAALALMIPMEAGLPIPLPMDLVILLVGERAAAGAIPLWLAVLAIEVVAVIGTGALLLACRGPGTALIARLGPRVGLTRERMERATAVIERRGRPALAIGRGTPGLRTATVVAAGASGLPIRRALPPLLLGSSFFLQLHLFLGYFLGPAARDVLEQATLPAIVVVVCLVAAAAVFWIVRRGRRAGAEAWAEAACPACVLLGALGDRESRREEAKVAAGSPI